MFPGNITYFSFRPHVHLVLIMSDLDSSVEKEQLVPTHLASQPIAQYSPPPINLFMQHTEVSLKYLHTSSFTQKKL